MFVPDLKVKVETQQQFFLLLKKRYVMEPGSSVVSALASGATGPSAEVPETGEENILSNPAFCIIFRYQNVMTYWRPR